MTSLATRRSTRFESAFSTAPSVDPVSAAKPIRYGLSDMEASPARMSGVGSRVSDGGPSARFSLRCRAPAGRKSATAAAMTATSTPAARSQTASAISWAVSTVISAARGGAGRLEVETSVTSAPRAAASAAIAYPIFPEERLPMKRTGSIGSRVPPAVTSTFQPSSGRARSRAAASTISAGSAIRPTPSSPPASAPVSGPMRCAPRLSSAAMLCLVAGCSHISVCIAGANSTGASVASKVADSKSGASPLAILPRV